MENDRNLKITMKFYWNDHEKALKSPKMDHENHEMTMIFLGKMQWQPCYGLYVLSVLKLN